MHPCKFYETNINSWKPNTSKPLFVVDSPNLIKELRTYKWKVDKNNKPLDEPVKFNDDGMDAMRYGFYNGLKAANKKISWF